jgi:hypothetical protein
MRQTRQAVCAITKFIFLRCLCIEYNLWFSEMVFFFNRVLNSSIYWDLINDGKFDIDKNS